MNYKLGQIIETDKYLKRERSQVHITNYPWVEFWRKWNVKPCEPKKVMVIGKRVLCNGTVYREENCNMFDPAENVYALLVVENLRNKPFYIPMP